ncbi:Lrp/AsnC family transcriptional regulator [Kiloniella laminariae]|uniref:Lrp/AsnC family transcriptional regulator n=1 Tax=Kiloniella laminariae TaxID=454162 RepID=A0ABT4LIQ3_9PROT|nr:Lrp/AsnC family transcriptional regulator [Kiloniella laminariae]MCZ4280990.1 Lrp/AsnC family transcriptional regulator [Kiloniella laminariae]
MTKNLQLDKMDQKILSILQKEARITNQELSERVNLSPSSCLNRVRKLEERGFIGPFFGMVDLERVCRSVMVIATVTLKDHSREQFKAFQDYVQDIPEVVECYMVSGSFDFCLRIVAPDMARYNEINDYLLDATETQGVMNISSHVVLNTSKHFSGYPIERLL